MINEKTTQPVVTNETKKLYPIKKLQKMLKNNNELWMALAKYCKVNKYSIRNWYVGERKPSAKATLKVEKFFKGAITKYEIRPDIFKKDTIYK